MAEYQSFDFPIDHFGLVASPLIERLLNQSSNRRSRKSALRNLVNIAKISNQIPREWNILAVGLRADYGGSLWLHFSATRLEKP